MIFPAIHAVMLTLIIRYTTWQITHARCSTVRYRFEQLHYIRLLLSERLLKRAFMLINDTRLTITFSLEKYLGVLQKSIVNLRGNSGHRTVLLAMRYLQNFYNICVTQILVSQDKYHQFALDFTRCRVRIYTSNILRLSPIICLFLTCTVISVPYQLLSLIFGNLTSGATHGKAPWHTWQISFCSSIPKR